ncbi:hypothetical protein [Idiomarina aminovorans]|nr:hypothetical protein [Idiomarina sp. ATCH4]MCK7460493.1 hypothetical protein [Idiomarina sp. ATCH4]
MFRTSYPETDLEAIEAQPAAERMCILTTKTGSFIRQQGYEIEIAVSAD